ncbi:MAG: ABC transporter ATP-binding protein [Myxococcales bacterium FL481]|nr:MAG: ABC transporter ATP-binding protein [Myxococcales bacterium FL481]
MHPMLRLWRYARPFQRSMRIATLFSLLNKLFDIAPEILIGVLVDTVVKREHSLVADFGIVDVESQLLALAGLTVVIWTLESAFQYLHSVRWRNIAQGVQHGLRLDVYDHVQRLPLAYFEDRSSGQVLSIINDDINQLERFLNQGANDLIQVVFSSLAVGAIFFFLTPQVALVALVPVPLILVGAFYFQRRLAPRYAAVRQRAAALNGIISNNLAGLATIKAFVGERHELGVVQQASERYQRVNADAIRVASAITPVIRMAVLVGFVATLYYGGRLTLQGQLEVGAYSVLVFLTQRLLWPLTRLAEMTDLYQRSSASAQRALDLLDTRVAQAGGDQQWPHHPVRGEIRFDAVSLSYGEQPALRDVSLTVPAGSTCAFVGATGSGKTSLLKLLLGFRAPTSGRIFIDDVNVATLELAELRGVIGFVNQDVFLVDGSVADNIAYGTFGASWAAIEAAARAAEADAFVRRLPQGYETRVGERGQKLSGGQRQRVAIARAILKDPPLLVLDEATSAVDNETEAAIQRSLATITRDRTTLFVAHRLSTIVRADQICVLDRGEIVERGTHAELLDLNGQYAALWRLQTGQPESAATP